MEQRSKILPNLINTAQKIIEPLNYDLIDFSGEPAKHGIAEKGDYHVGHTYILAGRHYELLDVFSKGKKVLALRKTERNSCWHLVSMKRGEWEIGFLLAA